MSNIIPPLLSNSPPPPPSPDEEDDDEFGDFTGHIDCSYSCDNLSLPSTPEHSPTKVSILNGLDINFNTDSERIVLSKEAKLEAEKDFQDKRKCDAEFYVFMPTTVEEQEVFNKFNELDIKTELMQPLEDLHKNSSDDGGSSVKTNLESNIKNGIIETDFKQLSIKDIPVLAINDDEIEFTDGDMVPKDNPVHCYENNHLSENLETEFCDSPGDNTELNSTKFTILEMLNPPSSTNIPAISTFDTSCEALVEEKNVDVSVDTDKQNGSNQSLTNIEQKQLENIDDTTNTQLNSDSKNKSLVDENIDYAIESNSESVTNEYCLNSNIDQSSHLSSDDEFGEFADFNSHKNIEDNSDNCDKNSDDFGDFTSTAVCLSNEEDFGNFAIFPEPEEPVLLLLDEKQAFEKANNILKEMFPIHEEIQEYFEHFVYEKEDFIFNKLQDITDTPALGYQWSKSASQKMLLMSLGIDARNILYGPSWNPSMPGFAANLSLEPLQPVKSECLSPSVEKSNQSPSVPIPPPTVDIPSVQFDWNSSGLTNPLDSVSKDSANEPSETFSNLGKPPLATPVLEAELVPKKVASKSDLEEKPEDFDDFDDFASFQCSTVQPPVTYNWSNAIPLRETYISNDNTSPNSVPKELPLDVEAWLQPTIVTPELPRKRSIDQEGELSNMCIAESGSENIESNIDDDLDDFQMALPEPKADILKDLCKSDILSPVNTQENKLMPDISKIDLSQSHTCSVNANEKLSDNDEDEFTDFHFSTPAKIDNTPKHVTTILEPLKPTPIHSGAASTPSNQINWPDPGITEEELKKFDDVFSLPIKKPYKDATKNSKEQSTTLDEDEWTEFVSVQKPSPVHKVKSNEQERTASPDLPLSVFNLGYIQPTRQPIPVITPQGIFQTKLSLNPTKISPKASVKANAISPKPAYQTAPSIISQQYASQAYSFSNSHTNRTSHQQKNIDDDEWGEFVSSPLPTQSVSNGYQQTQNYGLGNPYPNITMNPGHFVQSGSNGRRKLNVSADKKSTVPNFVLPELDFVAPKTRTSNTRKK